MSVTKIFTFIAQVKQEVLKVSWPTKKETTTSTMMVVIMVIISSLFFLMTDMVIHNVVQFILTLGN